MDEYPLTSAQRDIWFDQIAHPDLPLYNIGGYLRIEGPIDPQLFIQSMHRVVVENDSLRIMLRSREPIPTQEFVALDKLPTIEFPYKDYSQCENGYQRAIKWLKAQFSKPFSLYDSLLFRYAIVKASDDCYFYLNCQHHLIADGWTIMLVTNRLAQIYREQLNMRVAGRTVKQEAKLSYIDYINDEITYLDSNKYQRCQQFWREQYQNLPSTRLIAHFSSQTEAQDTSSAISSLPIDKQTFEQLKRFCESHKVSFFHFMLGVFYVYFMKYEDLKNNKNEEFIVGVPVLNRRGHRFKQTMGLFTSVIPQRLKFGLQLNFLQLLSQIKAALRDSYRAQRFPLSEIRSLVAKLHSSSDSYHKSHRQLFDITISQESFDYNCSFNGENVEAVTLHNGFEQTPLSIAIKEYHKHRDFRIEFVYNLASFSPDDIELLKNRIFYLISKIPDQLENTLSQISIIPEFERQQLLARTVFSEEKTEWIKEKNIIDWFDRQVIKEPNAIALVYGQKHLYYGDLKYQVEQFAGELQNQNIQPGGLIGVYIERSIEMIIAVLAILKMGGVYLPIDVSNPRARVKKIIHESNLKWVISQSNLCKDLPPQLTIINIERGWKPNSQVRFYQHNISGENLAYIIYTSGSSGDPKGVMNTHIGLFNLVQSQISLFEISESSHVMQFASLGFDASVSEIFTALCAGARLILCDTKTLHDYNLLLQIINHTPISHITLPPSILGILEASQIGSHCTVIAAGESCSLSLAKKWVKNRTFINAYGPTEGTVCSTLAKYKQQIKNISIGQPIPHVAINILGVNQELLPQGMPGEIYISGINLAQGYLNQPELSQQKFIDNPFLPKGKSSIYNKLYQSGDIGRLLPDGDLEYLGRNDHQVKIRGFRIELGEIEAQLLALFFVKQAVVIVQEGEHGQKKLIAFYTVQDSAVSFEVEKQSEQEVLTYLKQQLPDYMLPHCVNRVTRFPLTLNAKVDHKALLKQFIERAKIKPNTFASTPTEKKLMRIVADILENVSPGVLDKLHQYGMDSLQIIRIQMEINRQFKLTISLTDLFHLDTIRELSLIIDQRLSGHFYQLKRGIKSTNSLSQNKDQSEGLLKLQAKGDKPPLFIVTAGFRQIGAFKDLAGLLGDNQPFYLLQPGHMETKRFLVELLEDYIANIIAIEQQKIRLIGFSVGGLIAQKIGIELQKRGYTVELMILLGSPANISLLEIGFSSFCRIQSVFSRIYLSRQICMEKLIHFFFKDQGLRKHLYALSKADSRLKKYEGRIDYFEGKWSISRLFRWQINWKKNSSQLFMHLIPGTHNSIIGNPYNKELAKQIKQLLKKIDD